ncbi:MAG: ribbon-helix-helix domain-containing protein, partial [Alphaproteobacteria bacterium]|nr:ribbon-helix-helix domain-containing protein [Alphaproteobacteria bacterium]
LYDFIIFLLKETKMGSKTLSVTIPEELYARLDQKRKEGHYSRSEFVREALRRFLNVPTADATAEEIAAMAAGRAEIESGEFVTLDELKGL